MKEKDNKMTEKETISENQSVESPKNNNYSSFDKLKADVILTAQQTSNMNSKERAEFVDKQAEDMAEKISNSIDNFLENLFKKKKKKGQE